MSKVHNNSTPKIILGVFWGTCDRSPFHAKPESEILKSLKYSLFDSLIENRKFQTFQLHSPSGSDFMAILRFFLAEFEDKM